MAAHERAWAAALLDKRFPTIHIELLLVFGPRPSEPTYCGIGDEEWMKHRAREKLWFAWIADTTEWIAARCGMLPKDRLTTVVRSEILRRMEE